MPYIKKIELSNFKSFSGKKTSIALDRGFTVITGPNGSGKTNILDGVLFGLGETRARRLRAESLSKLIFSGNQSKKAKKRKAKVVIKFDNSDGRIPISSKAVTISREVNWSGQSIYRINGRNVSRARILEVLSVAGIDPTGHNIIPQGTVTKLTDVSPLQRRKIIEDLVGISMYDAERSKAEAKLREANITINTAMGRIEEVQTRIDALEEERNNLLRYKYMKEDMNRLEAIQCSYRINELEKRVEDSSKRLREIRVKLEELSRAREDLKRSRFKMEDKQQKLGSDVIDEGRIKITKIQVEISELRSEINDLQNRVEGRKSALNDLKAVRENRIYKMEDFEKQIRKSEERIEALNQEISFMEKEIKEKQYEYDTLSSRILDVRSKFADYRKRISEVESDLDALYVKILEKKESINRSLANVQALTSEKMNLQEQLERYAESMNDLNKSLKELMKIRKEEERRLIDLKEAVKRKETQKERFLESLTEAEKIAEMAGEAVIEFGSQREAMKKIARTEVSLNNIEELTKMGVITGIHGRLKNLIKINKKYSRGIESAAVGWLDAIVVEDYNVAFTCSETLKRLKLAKIKMIPLKEISSVTNISPPKDVDGLIGIASSLVKTKRLYEPAVSFVFGDTFLVKDEKIAISLSRRGYRAVTLDGDLYDAKGGMEAGYYRAPIDFSSLIPSETAIKSLDDVVKALKRHLSERRDYLSTVDEEVRNSKIEIVKIEQDTLRIEDEIDRTKKLMVKTENNLKTVENNITSLEKRIEEEDGNKSVEEDELQKLNEKTKRLQEELSQLRVEMDSSKIEEMENERTHLLNDIVVMKDIFRDRQREISVLKTNLQNIYKRAYEEAKNDINNIDKQIRELNKKIDEELEEKKKLEPLLEDLEREREKITNSLVNAKDEAQKISIKIREVNEKLRKVEENYERFLSLNNDIKLKIHTEKIQLNQLMDRLRKLNYDEPLDVSLSQLKNAESTLKMMEVEMERIGAVNQLAEAQYEEQMGRYKELSIRLNELEREKQSIIQFMEEIDRRKKDAFMNAFDQINDYFSKYFDKLTKGGKAYLKLENPEDPFSGGLDMIVQFPDKPSILVSGASGGERSVASVAFIFSIQKLTPTSFYILDEVDAHLDAFHVERLSELLEEEASESQFVVITLKPEMASRAHKIYGVYGRNGVSNVISTTIHGA